MSPSTRHAVAVVAAIAATAAGPHAQAQEHQVLLSNGAAAPDSGGQSFVSFYSAELNDQGDVFFGADLSGVADPGNFGLYLWQNHTVSAIAREGQSAHDITGNPAPIYRFLDWDTSLGDGGRYAYTGRVAGPGVSFPNEDAIWSGSGGAPSFVLREGTQIPGTSYGSSHSNASPTFTIVNSHNVLGFGSGLYDVATGAFAGQGLFTHAEGAARPVLVARSGMGIHNLAGATLGGLYDEESWNRPTFNDLGQFAFIADIDNHTATRAIVLASPNGRYTVGYRGMSLAGVPGMSGVTMGTINASKPVLNNLGQVAFYANLDGNVNDGNDLAVFMGNGNGLQLVAREGQQAPGAAPGTKLVSAAPVAINDRSQVIVSVGLEGGDTTQLFERAVLMGTPGNLRMVMRMGALAAGTTDGARWGTPNSGSSFSTKANHAGQFAAFSRLFGGGVTQATDAGIWLSDPEETLLVVREGDLVGGKTVDELFPTSPYTGGTYDINDFGQVLYTASFTDGSRSLVRYTPELHWRRTFGGHWDDYTNWTVGIDPAHVHNVTLAGDASFTVQGPQTDRTVKKLSLGGGQGLTTLALRDGATLNAVGGTTIASTGVLTGDGRLMGTVTNYGKIALAPDAVLSMGQLNNHGLITGDGTLRAVLNNATGGKLQVKAGKAVHLINNGVTLQHNSGLIEVIDGDLRLDNSILNAAGGLIAVENGEFRTDGALTNWGGFAITRGAAQVLGDIDNTSAGKLAVTGGAHATFFDDVLNNGTIQIAEGSAAVFLGLYTGAGGFTGAGTAYIEGDMRPGNSPAITSVEGNMAFGHDAELTLELAGLLPAVQHDALHVGGMLALGGALRVTLLDGFAPSLGDAFDLFDWDTLQGGFAGVVLPQLGGDLAWDTSSLYTTGVLSVTTSGVPEPASLALLATSALMIGVRRR